MKFKGIKPGMVIHCQTEEDAEALLEHLEEIGYCWTTGAKPTEHAFNAGYYRISRFENKIWLDCGTIDDEITEFSDLIEPDDSSINSNTDSSMSAVEVLEWIYDNSGTQIMRKVFGLDREGDVIDDSTILDVYSPEQIVDKITAYEAAKKAPKPTEVEWETLYTIRSHCSSLQKWENSTIRQGYETDEEIKNNSERIFVEFLNSRCDKNKYPTNDYYIITTRRCQVKKDDQR